MLGILGRGPLGRISAGLLSGAGAGRAAVLAMASGGTATGGSRSDDAPAADYVHDRQAFLAHYDGLRDSVVKDEVYAGTPSFATEWLSKMLDYNVPGGKLNRGMAVFDVVKSIKGKEAITWSDVNKANTLGWCIEWLQAFFLVADDIMDNSITRRGQPCWYRQPNVGLVAFNDSIILDVCIYRILHKTFASEPCYLRVLEVFHEVTAQTAHGQMLDMITASPPGERNFDRYTMDNYMNIITFKTAYYSFYLPVACGLLMSGVEKPEAFELARNILIPMGQYFQIQDDVLDCFADPAVLGKIGTDVQDNKCSWLICQALQRASPEQKQHLLVSRV
ncbi:unnamed protein product [Ostreobium quekettii]|uniref:Farnesyl pyrophosphate synthase n=1 Tax=Ostreobium quekettii TaxID=121088 RepID=A0A8S1J4J9_9CHLO|nr:unnamed protein product [Ostreobium quekettii]